MKVPTVGSVVKIRVRNNHGPLMIPPRSNHTLYEGQVLPSYKWLTDREFCLSGDVNFPIRVINIDLLEDLELISGKLHEISLDVKTYTVEGSKGNKYVVTSNSKGWTCTCHGFQFRKQCKHVSELSNKK